MKALRTTLVAFCSAVLVCATAMAQDDSPFAEAKNEKPAPSWDALTERAKELEMGQYSTEDLSAQVEKKQEHLDSLYEQRAAIEAQMLTITDATEQSIKQIDAIDDPVVRDESLLRFKGAKDVRTKTLRATLDAVNETITRETKELAMLQRLLQERAVEARLNGQPAPNASSYVDFLAKEASRVRASENSIVQRVRQERITRVQQVVLPCLRPSVPDLTTAVMSSNDVATVRVSEEKKDGESSWSVTHIAQELVVGGVVAAIF